MKKITILTLSLFTLTFFAISINAKSTKLGEDNYDYGVKVLEKVARIQKIKSFLNKIDKFNQNKSSKESYVSHLKFSKDKKLYKKLSLKKMSQYKNKIYKNKADYIIRLSNKFSIHFTYFNYLNNEIFINKSSIKLSEVASLRQLHAKILSITNSRYTFNSIIFELLFKSAYAKEVDNLRALIMANVLKLTDKLQFNKGLPFTYVNSDRRIDARKIKKTIDQMLNFCQAKDKNPEIEIFLESLKDINQKDSELENLYNKFTRVDHKLYLKKGYLNDQTKGMDLCVALDFNITVKKDISEYIDTNGGEGAQITKIMENKNGSICGTVKNLEKCIASKIEKKINDGDQEDNNFGYKIKNILDNYYNSAK